MGTLNHQNVVQIIWGIDQPKKSFWMENGHFPIEEGGLFFPCSWQKSILDISEVLLSWHCIWKGQETIQLKIMHASSATTKLPKIHFLYEDFSVMCLNAPDLTSGRRVQLIRSCDTLFEILDAFWFGLAERNLKNETTSFWLHGKIDALCWSSSWFQPPAIRCHR